MFKSDEMFRLKNMKKVMLVFCKGNILTCCKQCSLFLNYFDSFCQVVTNGMNFVAICRWGITENTSALRIPFIPLGKAGMLGNWTWLKQERTCLKSLTSLKILPLLLPSVPPLLSALWTETPLCACIKNRAILPPLCKPPPPTIKILSEQDPLSPLKRDSLSNAKWLSWRVLMVRHLLKQKELKCQINLVKAPLTLEFLYQLPSGWDKDRFCVHKQALIKHQALFVTPLPILDSIGSHLPHSLVTLSTGKWEVSV